MSETLNPKRPVIIVDDEPQILISYDTALRMSGINHIISCGDSRQLMAILSRQTPQAILLDLMMPHLSGEALLPKISQEFPDVPVIVITGKDETQTAVSCMKHGAFDFLVKPVERDRLVTTVRQAVSLAELNRENRALREQLLTGDLKNPELFSKVVTNNPAMRAIFQYIEAIAPSNQPVLVTGETGTGKELLARAIHDCSGRAGKFVSISLAGLDDDVFAETLFGNGNDGKPVVQQAAGGTLFLDEVGHLSMASQLKLMRLLQEGEFFPVGAERPVHTDARIVVATNQDLKALQDMGRFRKDLYYRLCTHWVHVPALRDRLDDLPMLLDGFLEEAALLQGKKKPRAPRELVSLLSTHYFPGNIRELRTMVHDAMSCHTSMMLSMDVFKKYLFDHRVGVPASSSDSGITVVFGPKLPTMNDMKQRLIEEAMRRTGGNKTLAASMLGISRQAISWRERQELKRQDDDEEENDG